MTIRKENGSATSLDTVSNDGDVQSSPSSPSGTDGCSRLDLFACIDGLEVFQRLQKGYDPTFGINSTDSESIIAKDHEFISIQRGVHVTQLHNKYQSRLLICGIVRLQTVKCDPFALALKHHQDTFISNPHGSNKAVGTPQITASIPSLE